MKARTKKKQFAILRKNTIKEFRKLFRNNTKLTEQEYRMLSAFAYSIYASDLPYYELLMLFNNQNSAIAYRLKKNRTHWERISISDYVTTRRRQIKEHIPCRLPPEAERAALFDLEQLEKLEEK